MTLKMKMTPKNEDDPKNEINPKNEVDPKNEAYPKNEDDPKIKTKQKMIFIFVGIRDVWIIIFYIPSSTKPLVLETH